MLPESLTEAMSRTYFNIHLHVQFDRLSVNRVTMNRLLFVPCDRHIYLPILQPSSHTYVPIYVSMYVYVCMYVWMYVCIYVCVCMYYVCYAMYVCMNKCMHVYMYFVLCTCVYVYMYLCKYVHIYICMYAIFNSLWLSIQLGMYISICPTRCVHTYLPN
jgi:nuclear pore complex protein Nup62